MGLWHAAIWKKQTGRQIHLELRVKVTLAMRR
jgi:hypothetical protein